MPDAEEEDEPVASTSGVGGGRQSRRLKETPESESDDEEKEKEKEKETRSVKLKIHTFSFLLFLLVPAFQCVSFCFVSFLGIDQGPHPRLLRMSLETGRLSRWNRHLTIGKMQRFPFR